MNVTMASGPIGADCHAFATALCDRVLVFGRVLDAVAAGLPSALRPLATIRVQNAACTFHSEFGNFAHGMVLKCKNLECTVSVA